MKKAIFINTRLIFGAEEQLKLLKESEFTLIAVCNAEKPSHFSIHIDAFYYCPHDAECDCKSPKAGLIFEATKDLNLDLKHSWVIAETLDDIEAGNRAGCKTILLANGAETQWQVTPLRQPEFLSANFEYATGAVVLKSIYQMIRQEDVS